MIVGTRNGYKRTWGYLWLDITYKFRSFDSFSTLGVSCIPTRICSRWQPPNFSSTLILLQYVHMVERPAVLRCLPPILSQSTMNKLDRAEWIVHQNRNVHHALHQASPWGVAEPSTPVHAATPTTSTQGRYQYPTGDNDIGARYDAAFHAYLWATMQKHPFTCFRDW